MIRNMVFIAAILLTIVALLHLLRVIFPIPLVIGALAIPIWVNVVGFIVTGILACYLFRAARALPGK